MPESEKNMLHWRILEPTPVGRLLLAADTGGLRCLYFADGPGKHGEPFPADSEPSGGSDVRVAQTDLLNEAAEQLNAWFAGRLRQFDLPLAPQGTEFQQRVWAELCEIPWGQTTTYGEVARRIGQPTASRAVGLANGRNPISIIIPCHRVIGRNGQLTGYGGGLNYKKTLLQLEGSWPLNRQQQRGLFDLPQDNDPFEPAPAPAGNS